MPSRAFAVFRSFFAIASASARVGWHTRRRSLPDLVTELRRAESRAPLDPRLVVSVLERILPVIPPYRMGRCIKRSLLLLDLWSRAGLSPCLHLGIRFRGAAREGHAWISTREPELGTFRPPDVLETWAA